VSAACLIEFVAANAYAFAHLDPAARIVRRLGAIVGTTALTLLIVYQIHRWRGDSVSAVILVAACALPLVVRAVDKVRAGH
jgi:hypothetical protein